MVCQQNNDNQTIVGLFIEDNEENGFHSETEIVESDRHLVSTWINQAKKDGNSCKTIWY